MVLGSRGPPWTLFRRFYGSNGFVVLGPLFWAVFCGCIGFNGFNVLNGFGESVAELGPISGAYQFNQLKNGAFLNVIFPCYCLGAFPRLQLCSPRFPLVSLRFSLAELVSIYFFPPRANPNHAGFP